MCVCVLCITGFDPWDVSKRGLADLLEMEQKPATVAMVNGVGGDKSKAIPTSTVSLETTSDLSWQDELKTIFPNVNISFGG